MCGIAGWLGRLLNCEAHVAHMVHSLNHRGPDAHGVQLWHHAGLVHTRLSIIDLSPTGAQPMANEDGTVWTAFNGEIYNHRELRHDLEIRGHVFRGRSDTEILPHLYEEDGLEFVHKLRGMFALAIYDTRTRTLILARDRFGIKPLFYAPGTERLVFASEINALLGLPGVDDSPDRQAVYDFAALFYIPAPETFYTGIRSLQPGEMLVADMGGTEGVSWKTAIFHKWTIAPDAGLTLERAADRADELVTAGVQRQLESDVKLGALLSGGIDSSLVSLNAQLGLRNSLQTFNVQFPDEAFDETWAAEAVAKHIGSSHETLRIDEGGGTWEEMTKLLLHAGQPFADTSIFAVHAVSKLMRQYVTVALSGDGGDEAFGGYNFYSWIAKIARWQRLPAFAWRGAACLSTPLAHWGILPERMPGQFTELAGADDIGVIENMFSWIRKEEHQVLCLDSNLQPVRRLFERQWNHMLAQGCPRLERLSALVTESNTRLRLGSNYLFKVDTASMMESLEIRVPMLDEDLFEFGLTLPHALKAKGQVCKRVLRAVAARRLPPEVATKPKWGFAIPVDKWVHASVKEHLSDLLLSPNSSLLEFFRPEAYRPIIKAFCDGNPCFGISRQGLYQRVVMLLSLELSLMKRKNTMVLM